MKMRFITDSMAGLDRRYIDKHYILVLSRTIKIGNDVFIEANMDYSMFYKSITNSHEGMTATDIPESEFYTAFQKCTKIGQSVVCTLASSKISEAYYNAIKAKERILRNNPNAAITIINSGSTSNQHGHITMVGVEYYEEDASYKQIVTQMKNSIEKNHLYLCPDFDIYTSEHHSIGFRKTVPIYKVEHGQATVFKNVPSKKHGINTLVSLFEDNIATYYIRHVTIFHVNNERCASELKSRIMTMSNVEVNIVPTSPVIGCDAGIGTVGLSWNVV